MLHYSPGQLFIITQFEEKCSEYSEMIDDPQEMVLGVMANKILELLDKVELLERRLKNVSSTSNINA
jgi:hypothetical protein